MRKLLSFAALLGGLAVLSPGLSADDTKGTGKGDKAGDLKLEGGYTIVSGESDGKPIPEERIKGHTVRFTGDKIVTTDKDKKEVYVATYKLDEGKKPAVIELKSVTPKEGSATGLIKKEGDTITLIYNEPGGDVPTDFQAKAKQNLFVLKNLNKGGNAGKDTDKSDR